MNLLTLERAPHEVVAYRNGSCLPGSDFVQRIEHMRVELQRREERTWGLFMDDSYSFAVSLCSLLLSHKVAVVLPNMQKGFLESVEKHIDGVLTDRQDTFTSLAQLSYCETPGISQPTHTARCQLPDGEIALFTSGSTGEPKLISKSFSQLLRECRVLEELWGDGLGDSVILSTVTHQHIYGLLFRIVWPLVSGRCFSVNTYKDPESFIGDALQLTRVTLVSSPAYLRRMTECVDLREVAPHVAMVFSSGGPLPNHAAVRIREQLGSAVREVYGSTETGGIAHRAQVDADVDVPWTALPSVDVKADPRNSCLMVASPFEGSGEWYSTADRVAFLEDGTFRLKGRADHIVKVEEKRLSLTELEQRLANSELVREAGATVLETSRTNVVVAVVPSDQGARYAHEHGQWQLQRLLKEYLRHYFEPVLLPRKWRFVDSLPLNPQGKILRTALLRLFELTDESKVTNPEIKQVSFSETTATLRLFMPPDLLYFVGHFPGEPVLPGVVQLDWAITFAREYLGVPERFRSIETAKFHAFITPNATVQLKLRHDPSTNTLHFTYTSEERSFSSGRILLGAEE